MIKKQFALKRHSVRSIWWASRLWPRFVGLVVALTGFWRSIDGELSIELTAQAMFVAIAFIMLHTQAGRRLLLLGWLFLLGVVVLNLWLVEVNWETIKTLLIVIVVGALWFVDLTPVLRAVHEHQSPPPHMGDIVLGNKKAVSHRR